MNKKIKVFSLGLGLIGVALMAPESGKAAPCADCHTMHAMQGGVALVDTPNESLLKNSTCIGCHTGNNSGGTTPYVLGLAVPTYGTDLVVGNTLAGGNFYWVDSGVDTLGHNVVSIKASDTIGNTPPGWNAGFTANGTVTAAGAWGTQLTCAGTYGCHGNHAELTDFAAMSGSHHANDTVIDGSTIGKSYRFLNKIIGKEDPDWEYTRAANDHNQYYGYVRASDTPPAAGSEGAKGISYLCAECHGNFHSDFLAGNLGADSTGTATSPWLRHPTDIDMNDLAVGTEYKSYGGGGANSYQPLVPVATDRAAMLLAAASPITNVFTENGDAIVTCISCHRAHGSPYPDLMRWDYNGDVLPADECSAGADNAACGCFQCHTTKDAG
ncbi:MAG: hypothetical protein MUO63_23035 [Desulfobulbaceae bacterium]|nr:hypothetical protein [Desulfobulbaceae bacterium]